MPITINSSDFLFACPAQSSHRTFTQQSGGCPSAVFIQAEQVRVTSMIPMRSNQSTGQYPFPPAYKNQMQKDYARCPTNDTFPATAAGAFPMNCTRDRVCRDQRQLPPLVDPINATSYVVDFRPNKNVSHRNIPGSQIPVWNNTAYPRYANASHLSSKIRIIFVPTPRKRPQQPCTGSLGMPPFLNKRLAQPRSLLPLPPPLPQISSLPLTPAVQQRVMQQYVNPAAVLPFGGSWPSSQSAMPMCMPLLPQPPMMPVPALPPPQYGSYPSVASLALPIPTPFSFPRSAPLTSQAPAIDYPSMCRACVPVPPPLNVPVTGDGSTYHHVPADASVLSARPAPGRMTPLLRQPIAMPNVSDGRSVQQRYPYLNASVAGLSRSNQLPPLPPGARIISDGYISKPALTEGYVISKTKIPVRIPDVTKTLHKLSRYVRTGPANLHKSFKTHLNGNRVQTTASPDNTYPLKQRFSNSSLPYSSSHTTTDSSCTLTSIYSHNSSTYASRTSLRCSSDNSLTDRFIRDQWSVASSPHSKQNVSSAQSSDDARSRPFHAGYAPFPLPSKRDNDQRLESIDNKSKRLSMSDALTDNRLLPPMKNNQTDQQSSSSTNSSPPDEEEIAKLLRMAFGVPNGRQPAPRATNTSPHVSWNSVGPRRGFDSLSISTVSTLN